MSYARLHEAATTWAYEYSDTLLTPLDNYISRSTDVFLAAEGGATRPEPEHFCI